MKTKLVFIGGKWKRDPKLKKIARYFEKERTKFKDAFDEICERNIPVLKEWGPAETYFQDPDFASPVGKHNRGKFGVTICFSQLYDKKDRKLQEMVDETLALVVKTLRSFHIETTLQLYSETHVSSLEGKSYFIPCKPVWL